MPIRVTKAVWLFVSAGLAGCVAPGSSERVGFRSSGSDGEIATPRIATLDAATGKQGVEVESVVKARVASYRLPKDSAQHVAPMELIRPASAQILQMPLEDTDPSTVLTQTLAEPVAADDLSSTNMVPIDLGAALQAVGGSIPVVGLARWRTQEAYARLDQAKLLWLPTLQTGFSFHRHDGNLQASDGTIVDVNRNSFQYGLGIGGVGAGTTQRPGVLAQFDVADAWFQPLIAEKTAWAASHAASGVTNRQLLDVAIAYFGLLASHQQHRILEQSRDRTSELAKLTSDFAATGQGPQADADRLQTELTLAESRVVMARERMETASSQLTQLISLPAGQRFAPLEPSLVPVEMVSLDQDKSTLIATGLRSRPELKESQALVVAACEAHKRQKYAPFIPSVLLGFSTGGFGGGLRNNLRDINSRYDFDAGLLWGLRNMGLGEHAAKRATSAQVQQSKFEVARLMDQVASEIDQAHAQSIHRAERITITGRAIQTAQDSYDRNLSRIRDGQGLPIEVLQSVRALEDAQRAYLTSVAEYNEAQFRLHWAIGWPYTGVPAGAK